MRSILSERTIVAVLFVLVLITFSLAHEDTKKMEKIYLGAGSVKTPTEPVVKNENSAINEKTPLLSSDINE